MSMNWAKPTRTLLALSLLTQVSLYSWSRADLPQSAVTMPTDNFPFSNGQGWYTEESYLLMKPYMGNMSYGNKDTFVQVDASDTTDKIKVKNPEYDWSSGVRIMIGRYLPNHDHWDIGFTTTFLYSDTKDRVNPDASNVVFNPSFYPGSTQTTNKGQFQWRLNYWTLDLLVGRLFAMTSTTVFHPYFGLRGSLQYQHAKETSVYTSQVGLPITINQNAKIDNDFWGIGPSVGTSFIYYFASHFSFLANLSASLLVGTQDLKEDSYFNETVNSSGVITTSNTNFRSDDSTNVIRTNLNASIGLGWERWLNNNTVRIAPSVNFEGSLWFAMNQLYNIYPASDTQSNIEQRRQGNLGLMGVSFNLQVDF